MKEIEIVKAHQLLEDGQVGILDEFLAPFMKESDPYAKYFKSRYSLSSWSESSDEFEKRRVGLLVEAANSRVPEALYQLSALYFTGDGVPLDCEYGKKLLEMAAEQNYGLALYSIGINSFYGANGFKKDVDLAKNMMLLAKEMNVEGAEEFFSELP